VVWIFGRFAEKSEPHRGLAAKILANFNANSGISGLIADFILLASDGSSRSRRSPGRL
jgi:hypothetical protein